MARPSVMPPGLVGRRPRPIRADSGPARSSSTPAHPIPTRAPRTRRRRRLASPGHLHPSPIPRVPFVRRARCRVKRLTRPDPSILPLLRTGAHIPGPVVKLKVPREFRTGTVRKAELPLPPGVRARRDGDGSRRRHPRTRRERPSTRQRPRGRDRAHRRRRRRRGFNRRPRRSQTPALRPRRRRRLPPRPLRNWTESNHSARCRGSHGRRGSRRRHRSPRAPFGWVPSGADEATHFVRPRTASCPCGRGRARRWALRRPRTRTRSPKSRLSRGGAGDDPSAPGVGARSRYFTQHGQFAWAPCWVLITIRATTRTRLSGATRPVRKRARRLNLIFDAEDPAAFRTRLRKATTLRDEAEAAARYRTGRSDGFHRRYRRGAHRWVERVERLADGRWRRRSEGGGVSGRVPGGVPPSGKRALLDLNLRDRKRARRIRERWTSRRSIRRVASRRSAW